jgi:hypothetical protein
MNVEHVSLASLRRKTEKSWTLSAESSRSQPIAVPVHDEMLMPNPPHDNRLKGIMKRY